MMKNSVLFKIFLFPLLVMGLLFLSLDSVCFAQEPPPFWEGVIVITASAHPQSLEKSLSSVTVLQVNELREQGINYLQEALCYVAGADLKSNGYLGGIATLSLRGTRAEQVLFLLDGQRLNSPQNGVFDLSAFPLDNLERIEIVESPLSALYGADALGGVINLISKKPGEREGKACIFMGSFGQRKYLVSYQDKISNFGYRFNFDLIDSQGFRTNSDFNGKDFTFNLDMPENLLSSNFSYAYQKAARGVPGSIVYPSDSARQNDENNLFCLSSSFRLPWEVNSKFQLHYQDSSQRYSDPLWGSESDHKNKKYGFDWIGNAYAFHNQLFTGGLTYLKGSVASNEIGDHTRDDWAVFLQDEWSISENAGLLLGARLDRFSTLGKVVTPRVGLKYQLADITLKTSWSQGFRAPTFNELYWPESAWAAGNPDLKPEEGQMYDLEVAWKGAFGQIKLAGFSGRTSNMINWGADSEGVWRPQNLDSVNRQGLELGAEIPGDFVSLFFNTSWQNVVELTSGREVTYMPKYKMNGGLGVKNGQDSLGGALNLRYVGWRYAENNAFSRKILPSFLTADLSAYFKMGDFTLRAGINNLFDVEYQEIADYPASGRNLWASAGFEF